MFTFEVNYTGADRVKNSLNGLNEAFSGKDQRSILRQIGALYLADTESRFDKEHDVDRKKWTELSDVTIRLKKYGTKGRDKSIMDASHRGVWTGDLASSLKMRFEGNSVVIGSDIPYAKPFHYGVKKLKKVGKKATIPWGKTPPRRFLGRNARIDGKALTLLRSILIQQFGLDKSFVNENFK